MISIFETSSLALKAVTSAPKESGRLAHKYDGPSTVQPLFRIFKDKGEGQNDKDERMRPPLTMTSSYSDKQPSVTENGTSVTKF